MTMTKTDMVRMICEKMDFASKKSTEIVDQVFGTVKETTEDGKKTKIPGFGILVVRHKRPRKGRNPKTGEEMAISGRRVVTFNPSNGLRKALNKEEGSEIRSAFQGG